MFTTVATIVVALVAASCGDGGGGPTVAASASSCMTCHNGSQQGDYSGPGIEDPHPFGAAASMECTTCHGGNPLGADKDASHVPPPPEIGDDANLIANAEAYFNRLTLTGIDRFPDYQVGGITYSPLDWLQFVNPGDLRVVTTGQSCGQCHAPHVDSVEGSLLATEAGVLSGALYAAGVDNQVAANQGLYEDTAADLAFRAVSDPGFVPGLGGTGEVGSLIEHPVYSVRNDPSPDAIHNNPAYDAFQLVNDVEADGSVTTGSNLANLYHEQVAFTCGDCHLGSAGANNRYGDFRSSGCTACHMRKSLSGRSGSGDPNVDPFEPADPDDIDEPETSHLDRHLIRSVAKTLPSGEFVTGIDDYSCAGCHQGSNRTVMQYWGIRLDQNQDVRRGDQYPAQPASYTSTSGDPRLFDPVVGNNTFNGRNRNQYLLEEDYDGDGRDDTPPDVHYDAGMGCIDCHGSYDLHGGDVSDAGQPKILSRMGQAVGIECESCHGSIGAYATTQTGVAWDGSIAELAVDGAGNVLPHVVKEGSELFLYSRLTGVKHFVPQTLDTIVQNGTTNPFTAAAVYNPAASYAMGRADGSASTGIGPQQDGGVTAGFAHSDSMDCATCHASWTNTCMGCHLEGEYDTGNNFSNITGERIVFEEDNADFVYQSPVFFQLGVSPDDEITQVSPNTKAFFRYEDLNNNTSKRFGFSDRQGNGANKLAAAFPSMSHNSMMAHSIRGRVDSSNEGPRYCVACHLTDDGLANYGAEYAAFRTAMATNDFASLDFGLLTSHIGQNPGNQIDSPLWVHMVAGLGSGLFLFDEEGGAMNPIDDNANRAGSEGTAPKDQFDVGDVFFNLDRIVDENGVAQGSSNHPLVNPGAGSSLRDGAANPNMSGPLGATLIQRLTDPSVGIVLDSWIDADGNSKGNAASYLGGS